ncbi:MAG: hypothetical protein V2J10_02650 [Wenzhouxiangella sp.]|jgi:hypothetical protein|nr:hypothetical protein [Wenzhouxiangella sp.]
MSKLIPALFALLLLSPLPVIADESEDDEPAPDLHPQALASESDLVALVQVDRTNYERRRGAPVAGNAWLDVLLPYKVQSPVDRIRVVEEGFGEDRCYFDDVPLWAEQPRYLVFLKAIERGNFQGHRSACKLQVLVTADNRYAVRWPQDELHLNEADEAMIQALDFVGPGSWIDVSEMTSIRLNDLRERYRLEDAGDGRYRYTRGILLEDFRTLLGAENLTVDRQQLGR